MMIYHTKMTYRKCILTVFFYTCYTQGTVSDGCFAYVRIFVIPYIK